MSDQAANLRDIQPISGPFEIKTAEPPTPDHGGTLDRGIVGRLPDGRRVVIGEVWAACPAEDVDPASGLVRGAERNLSRISIDTDAMAQRIVDGLNRLEAVEFYNGDGVCYGCGGFKDEHEHACVVEAIEAGLRVLDELPAAGAKP